MSSHLGAVTRTGGFPLQKNKNKKTTKTSCPTSGEKRFIRGYCLYTTFDFKVDEGKERLNPSRDKDEGKHRIRKVEKFCAAFLPPAGAYTSLTSRINGMTTQLKTTFFFKHEDKLGDTLQEMVPVPTNVQTVHQTSSILWFIIERNPDGLELLSPTHGQRYQQQSGQTTPHTSFDQHTQVSHARLRDNEIRKLVVL